MDKSTTWPQRTDGGRRIGRRHRGQSRGRGGSNDGLEAERRPEDQRRGGARKEAAVGGIRRGTGGRREVEVGDGRRGERRRVRAVVGRGRPRATARWRSRPAEAEQGSAGHEREARSRPAEVEHGRRGREETARGGAVVARRSGGSSGQRGDGEAGEELDGELVREERVEEGEAACWW